MWLHDEWHGQQLRCLDESCRAVRKWNKETVTAYVRFLNVTCPTCGSLPEVTAGLFVRCSRAGCDWAQPFRRLL